MSKSCQDSGKAFKKQKITPFLTIYLLPLQRASAFYENTLHSTVVNCYLSRMFDFVALTVFVVVVLGVYLYLRIRNHRLERNERHERRRRIFEGTSV